jgi:solute carrier family 25 aspartate/glutamate transporter 12/13
MVANLAGVAPEKSIKIMAYTACHSSLLAAIGVPPSGELPFAWEAAAGAAAGASQSIISCPLEAVKIPLQMAAGGGDDGAPGGRPRLAAVVASLGWSGLFRGFDVCLARDTLTSAIFFAVFAWAKVALAEAALRAGMEVPFPFLLKLLAGGFAGIPAALVTTPLDVVKTRLQASSEFGQPGEEGEPPPQQYSGTLDCAACTVRDEGWQALWIGAGERVARLSPQLGISLALYEILLPM